MPAPEQDRYSGELVSPQEVSLIDLLLVLGRRKLVVVGVALAALGIGTTLALLKRNVYVYRATVEIGSVIAGSSARPIENPQNTLSKVQESYIPLVLNRHAKASGDDRHYAITATLPKNSEVILLEARGVEAAAPTYLSLLGETVSTLQAEHRRIVASLDKENEIKRNSEQMQISALGDAHRLLLADKERIDTVGTLLESQIEGMQRLLNSAEQYRRVALEEPRDEVSTMALLMLANETREIRHLLSQLQERLYLEVGRERDGLVKALADNQREQREAQDRLSKLELDLASFRETRAVVEPMRSPAPVGASRRVIVLLSLVIGLFGGIFTAFLVEFSSKVRTAARAKSAGAGPGKLGCPPPR